MLIRKAGRALRSSARGFLYRFEYPRLRELQDRFQGRRGFIVASGPSLAAMNLAPLAHEFVCVLNNGVRAIGEILPQATMHAALDNNRYRRFAPLYEEIALTHHIPYRFVGFRVRHRWRRQRPRANRPYFVQSSPVPFAERPFADDLMRGISSGRSVVLAAAQLMAFMGFRKIYIIGCDLDYSGDGSPYFYALPGDDARHEADPEVQRRHRETEAANADFALLETALAPRGVHLFNAGRGGRLTALPRVDFESLFGTNR